MNTKTKIAFKITKILGLMILFFFLLIIIFLSLTKKPKLLHDFYFSTAVYDENKNLLRLTLTGDEKYRLFVPLSKIPQQIITATLLQEDKYFYYHFGINPLALLKAAEQTYILKSRRMGASTITMQVARMRFNLNSKKILGKILQIFYALQLEWFYSKNDILEAYLNLAPYGGNIEGIGAASLIYFKESVEKIRLPQILTLTLIPQNPNKLKPPSIFLYQSRQRLFKRWIKIYPQDKKYASSIDLPITTQTAKNLPFEAPHFVYLVLKDSNKNKEINTTLNINLQNIITRVIHQYIIRKKNIGVNNAAVLLIDSRDMAVKSFVGSADFFNNSIQGQINGIEAKRSPGSTLKPFIYALALDQGLIHPNTVLKDVAQSFGSYNPENFDNDFMGPITAQDALALSRNIPAIYLASQLKSQNLHTLLTQTEVSELKPLSYYGLSLTLGGAELSMHELSALYAMLANQGVWQPLRMNVNKTRHTKKTLLSPEASYLVMKMLNHNTTNSLFNNIAYKTGTSSGYRDAWTIGFVGPYVLSVWLGNFDNSSNPAFIGKNIATPLFFEIIAALKQKIAKIPALTFQPEKLNITQIEVCKASGLLPTAFCLDRKMTDFIPGVSPIKTDNIFREVAINSKTGLRTCHIDKNTRFEIFEFWPSDLLSVLKKAKMHPKIPPLFEQGCEHYNQKNIGPQIVSPNGELKYIVQVRNVNNNIPFTAITDASISNLYWFINNNFYAKVSAKETLFWQAKPGSYVIRVVDDQGLTDRRRLQVQLEN